MFKQNVKAILIFVIILQLIMPFSMLFYQANINYHLNKEENYFKLPLRHVSYFSDSCYLEFLVNNSIDYSKTYLVYEKNDGETSFTYSDSKPIHNNYLYVDSMFDLFSISYTPDYPFDYNLIEDSNTIYDRDNEATNISNQICDGPETDAYVIVSVYKGNIKVVSAFIADYTIEEYLNAYENNEIDLMRFQYIDEFNFSEYFDNLPESQKELFNNIAGNLLS